MRLRQAIYSFKLDNYRIFHDDIGYVKTNLFIPIIDLKRAFLPYRQPTTR